ncbi:MAG: hypothetical protein SWX82_00860 [Cyanobacteriota bacterium]|nr:hypothetical protein [Cyanobacteriota bacterium]
MQIYESPHIPLLGGVRGGSPHSPTPLLPRSSTPLLPHFSTPPLPYSPTPPLLYSPPPELQIDLFQI